MPSASAPRGPLGAPPGPPTSQEIQTDATAIASCHLPAASTNWFESC